MRKVKDAVDLSTNEKVYFRGHAKATYMSDGRTVEEAINQGISSEELDAIHTEITSLERGKVDKVEGKQLSSNDYTDEEKEKLSALENYDDTKIKQDIADLQEKDKATDAELAELSEEVSELSERVDNLPTAESSVFKAVYGVTTYEEIKAAYDSGKVVHCDFNNLCYTLVRINDVEVYLNAVKGAYSYYMYCRKSDNDWVVGYNLLENTSNKVTSLSESSTDTQYPSAKAVYGAIEGVSAEIEYLSQNAIIEGKADNPNEGDLAVENGTLHQYSRSSKEYDAKYKAVIGTSANDKEYVFQPNYRYDGLNKLDGQSNSLGIVEYIPVRFEQAVFGEADVDGNRWAEEFQISFYFNESGRVGNVNQLIAFFDADKNHIIGSWYFGNAQGADDKKYLCTQSVISADEAIDEADDATRIYKNTMNLAKTTDGSSKWGIDANGNLIGTLANVRYIGYGMIYSSARGHSIMLNNEYSLVEGWENTRKTINSLVASENNFGKVRMWLSQDAEGNVLNISTEL